MDRRKFLGMGVVAAAAVLAPTTTLMAKNFRTEKPDAWKAADSKSAIAALYGAEPVDTTDITVKAPKLAENGGSIPINVKSELAIESIAVFQDANPRSAVAVFTVPEGGIINYDFRIKMRKTSNVTVVAKTKDGKLLKVVTPVEVSIGGCGG
jgi:sulfur-oxidizing protein SoxY